MDAGENRNSFIHHVTGRPAGATHGEISFLNAARARQPMHIQTACNNARCVVFTAAAMYISRKNGRWLVKIFPFIQRQMHGAHVFY
jgi:hypothetical protein